MEINLHKHLIANYILFFLTGKMAVLYVKIDILYQNHTLV